RDVAGTFKVDVANQLAVCGTCDTDVDNGSSGFDVLATERAWLASSNDENVGGTGEESHVRGAGMAQRYRGIGMGRLVGQQDRNRPPDKLRAAHDDDMRALHRGAGPLQEHLDAQRRAGDEPGTPET